MAKNIILCSDGTANAGGQGLPTNVWAIYQAIDINGWKGNPAIPRQIAFHDDGVGTESWKLLKIIGGAFGFGLSRNIRQLYTALARNFEKGDRIYLFGFSRGAYTVRSLAGLISSQGILNVAGAGIKDPEDVAKGVKWVYRQYRAAHRRQPYHLSPDAGAIKRMVVATLDFVIRGLWWLWDGMRDELGPEFACLHASEGGQLIECIGVWDTVDAVGVPVDELRDVLDFLVRNNFHKHDLNRDIKRGLHALSIDDERKTFHPVMWDEDPSHPDQVKQVWFAGVHSNVGGGYPKQGLAHITLAWMMSELERDRAAANGAGLHFKPGALDEVAAKANPHDMLYDSRKGVASLYRYSPRNIAKICAGACPGKPAKIHDSVFERIARHTHDYGPGQIPRNIEIVATGAPTAAAAPGTNAAVAAHYTDNEALLAAGAKWVRRREVAYALSLGALLGLVIGGVVFYDPSTRVWWPGVPDYVEKGLKSFLKARPACFAGVTTALVVLFCLRAWFRARANAVYCRFWWIGRAALP